MAGAASASSRGYALTRPMRFMITIRPIPLALVPTDSQAAARISAPNYDEFQGDREIWELLRANPDSVLRVTMAHCDTAGADEIGVADSPDSLARAVVSMGSLRSGSLTREVAGILFVYEITGPSRPDVRQIGLGGMASTKEIRTDARPTGPIIRNEGVRMPKARGRAQLIEATGTIIGTVNNAVPDQDGRLASALESYADAHAATYQTRDHHRNLHRIWLIDQADDITALQELVAAQPEAYVADGNHRSAAAAMLGYDHFLAIFFTADRMGIAPYNRLVRGPVPTVGEPRKALAGSFVVTEVPQEAGPFQPTATHEVGLYTSGSGWLRLIPRPGSFDASDAARSIDHDIVQRRFIGELLGIADPGDDRLIFVGANKDAGWLQRRVDEGAMVYAVTLPAVTMKQFIEVCRQGGMMPTKSTWFEPKIRSGLVMALLD